MIWYQFKENSPISVLIYFHFCFLYLLYSLESLLGPRGIAVLMPSEPLSQWCRSSVVGHCSLILTLPSLLCLSPWLEAVVAVSGGREGGPPAVLSERALAGGAVLPTCIHLVTVALLVSLSS